MGVALEHHQEATPRAQVPVKLVPLGARVAVLEELRLRLRRHDTPLRPWQFVVPHPGKGKHFAALSWVHLLKTSEARLAATLSLSRARAPLLAAPRDHSRPVS